MNVASVCVESFGQRGYSGTAWGRCVVVVFEIIDCETA
jgi:hypothetical protein